MLLAATALMLGAWTETSGAAEPDRLDFAGNEAAQAALAIPGFLLSPHEALGSRTGSLAPTPAAIAPAEVPTDPDQREEAASIGAASPTMPKNLRAPPTRVRAWARSAPVRRDALHPPSTQPHDTYPTWAVRALQP